MRSVFGAAPQSEVRSNMWADTPGDATGLAALYTFKSDAMYNEPGGKVRRLIRLQGS